MSDEPAGLDEIVYARLEGLAVLAEVALLPQAAHKVVERAIAVEKILRQAEQTPAARRS